MSVPKRIQRKRTRGWKMPEGAVYVGRPTVWGNRWKPGIFSAVLGRTIQCNAEAVEVFSEVMARGEDSSSWRAFAREKLRGKDLACWCPLDQPCHADVLLEIANAGSPLEAA